MCVWCLCDDVDVVILIGGIGFIGWDVIVEVYCDVYEKEIDVFGIVFMMVLM